MFCFVKKKKSLNYSLEKYVSAMELIVPDCCLWFIERARHSDMLWTGYLSVTSKIAQLMLRKIFFTVYVVPLLIIDTLNTLISLNAKRQWPHLLVSRKNIEHPPVPAAFFQGSKCPQIGVRSWRPSHRLYSTLRSCKYFLPPRFIIHRS